MRALLPTCIDPRHVIGVVIATAEGADHTHAQLLVEVMPIAADHNAGLLIQLLEAGALHTRHQQQGGGITRHDCAIRAAIGAAGDAQTKIRIGNLAGVEHIELAAEIVCALQEERALFLIEQRKSIIEVELQLVGFNL